MKATLHGHVVACSPPQLAVRMSGHYLALPLPGLGMSRVDVVVRETRTVGDGKSEWLVAVHGVPAVAPVPPVLIHNDVVCQQPIAWVEVRAPYAVEQSDIHYEWPPPDRKPAARRAVFVECCPSPGPGFGEDCPDPDAYHVWSGNHSDRWWRKAKEES